MRKRISSLLAVSVAVLLVLGTGLQGLALAEEIASQVTEGILADVEIGDRRAGSLVGQESKEPGAEEPDGTGGPVKPAEDPEDPKDPEDPEDPGAEGPEEPPAVDPDDPGNQPGPVEPDPESGDQEEPGSQDPAEPEEPGVQDPEDPNDPGVDPDDPGNLPWPEEPGPGPGDQENPPGSEDPVQPEDPTVDPNDPGNQPGPEEPVEPTEPEEVDNSALQTAVDAASHLEEEGYTEESWGTLAGALAAAQAALADGEATQEEVDAVLAALNAAIAGLVQAEQPPVQEPAKPAVDVVITTDQMAYAPGDTARFTIDVENNGNVDLAGLLVEDTLCGLSQTISLAVGSAKRIYCEYVIPLDYHQLQITNSVSVSGAYTKEEEDPIPVSDSSTVTVDVIILPPVQPSLTVSIKTDRDRYQPGETVHFTVTVANSGQVDLTDLTVQDTLTGLDEIIAQLTVGEQWTGSSTFAIPEDFAQDKVTNSVFVQGEYEGQEIRAESTVVVTVLLAPMVPALLLVDIQTDKGEYRAGDTVHLSITLSNRGTESLSDIRLWVPLAELNARVDFLASGEETALAAEFDIPYNFYLGYFGVGAYAEGECTGSAVSGQGKALIVVDEQVNNPAFKECELPSLPDDWESVAPFDRIPVPAAEPQPEPSSMVKAVRKPFSAGKVGLSSYTDTVAVSKSAQRTQGCRAYQVTLGITGTPPPEKPVDVILVVDCSNSMDSGSPSSLYYAKEAAKEFAEQVLQNSANKVAVVSFAYDPGFFGWNLGNLNRDTKIEQGFSNNSTQVTNAINGLATYGGTNTEAGFIRARNLMQAGGRAEANKAIVFLTDGVPTVSIDRRYGPSEPTAHNDHTTAAYTAGQSCHALGYQVFTVNLLGEVPSKCVPLARDTMQKAQNAGYYETFSAADLSEIYSQISQQLNYSATHAVVADKIPANFELVPGSFQSSPTAPVSYEETTGIITWEAGTIGTSATLSYKIRAKEGYEGGTEVPTNDWATLTYTDINENPNQTKDFPIPLVDVPPPFTVDAGPDREVALGSSTQLGGSPTASGGTSPYTYLWTCDTDGNWSSTEANPAVEPGEDTIYTVTVADAYGCSKSDTVKVTILKGFIKVTKSVQNGSTTKKFPIYVQGNGHKWSMMLAHGQSATIQGLEPGTYTIREVAPMNYQCVSISPTSVTITTENINDIHHVTVTNKKVNDSWFWDDDEETNTFTVGSWTSGPEGSTGNSSAPETQTKLPEWPEAVLSPEQRDEILEESELPADS